MTTGTLYPFVGTGCIESVSVVSTIPPMTSDVIQAVLTHAHIQMSWFAHRKQAMVHSHSGMHVL